MFFSQTTGKKLFSSLVVVVIVVVVVVVVGKDRKSVFFLFYFVLRLERGSFAHGLLVALLAEHLHIASYNFATKNK